ncbi:Glyoxylase, beta-lactamase superfamily II [Chitinophaga sp. YR573]|uniref:MBL fold metallo-hydrolase n=1 Tax=Chitinophaga sp. YR573 TaxID=1881040 RepID=UPI0008AB0CD2|nr:MBL fold metallo-hydrolase [Chitinophaga sp. YR573]SEW28972.1 Glyoxylase, beta-lactamase superfamily II [Chitinophaga sp. YR573]
MKKIILAFTIGLITLNKIMAQELPKAGVILAANTKNVKIYTVVAPPEMFSNTTHVIELPHELVLVDGQFFAPYAQQVKALTDSLKKPITRFYISHDHPDHYIGFGDAFPDVPVYALQETKDGIEKEGQQTLEQRQKQFGPIIAKSLNMPSHVQQTGEEIIDGVKFIFEKSLNNEAAVSLIIKLPEVKAYIAQDVVYNKTHLFISGNSDGWRSALRKIENEKKYTLILPGHGVPATRSVLSDDLKYLDFVDQALASSKTKEEYKAKLLAAYPQYGGAHLIDIYLAYYLKKDWGK